MKRKCLLISSIMTIIGFSLLSSGCSSSLSENDSYTLPNGTVITRDRFNELQELRKDFENSCRAASGETEETSEDTLLKIAAMKTLLIEKYGDEAYNYFGETTIECTEDSCENSRLADYAVNTEVAMTDSEHRCWANSVIKDHWGIWWDYKEFKSILYYKNIVWNTGDIRLLTDAARLEYSDSNTSTKTIDYDWSDVDGVNPDPSFMGILEWEQKEATRGEVHTYGNTKWGWWFPQVTSVRANIDFYDTLLQGGKATVRIFR